MTPTTKDTIQKPDPATDKVNPSPPTARHAEPLTIEQRARWDELDATVRRGAQAIYEMGQALAEIREKHLYRSDYSSWEDYCRARLVFSKRQADRMICASGVVADLGPIGPKQVVPRTESQARELGRLETPEDRCGVWKEVVDQHGEAITAKIVKAAVDARLGIPPVKLTGDTDTDTADAATAEAATLAESDHTAEESASPQAAAVPQEEAGDGDEVVCESAESWQVMASDWTDGFYSREVIREIFEDIAEIHPKQPERAAGTQWLAAGLACFANGEVPADADEAVVDDLDTALHLLQQRTRKPAPGNNPTPRQSQASVEPENTIDPPTKNDG